MKQVPLVTDDGILNQCFSWLKSHNQFILINNPVKSIIFTKAFVHEILCMRNLELLHLSSLTLTCCVLDTNGTNSYGSVSEKCSPTPKPDPYRQTIGTQPNQFSVVRCPFSRGIPCGDFSENFYSKKTIPELRTLYIAFKEQVTLTDLRKIVKPLRTVASNRQTLRLTWLAHLFSMLRVPFQWMSRSSFLKKNSKIHLIKPFYIITLILNKEELL